MLPLVNYFPRMLFDMIQGEKIFKWASFMYFHWKLYTGLHYILFILDLNSEFKNFKL